MAVVRALIQTQDGNPLRVYQHSSLLCAEISDSDYRNENSIADALETLAKEIRKGTSFVSIRPTSPEWAFDPTYIVNREEA